jgi:hypothetical protein
MALFNDRCSEINFYFSVLEDFENKIRGLSISEKSKFELILKSNFLLMLYNLVEACVVSGFMEIYENFKNEGLGYDELIEEIQIILSNHEVKKIENAKKSNAIRYEKHVNTIIGNIVSNQPIILTRSAIGYSGNLDADTIKKICDKHGIRYQVSDSNDYLKTVKDKRNHLAHGDESFGDSAKDFTIGDLKNIKTTVVKFINDILDGMQDYFDNKIYLRKNEVKK